jgi:hypothetical protein
MQLTSPTALPKALKVVHRNRGQLCGQPWGDHPSDQHRRAADWIAELLGRKKMMIINDLHHRPAALRAISPRQANNGAAVELWCRAGYGFADE